MEDTARIAYATCGFSLSLFRNYLYMHCSTCACMLAGQFVRRYH